MFNFDEYLFQPSKVSFTAIIPVCKAASRDSATTDTASSDAAAVDDVLRPHVAAPSAAAGNELRRRRRNRQRCRREQAADDHAQVSPIFAVSLKSTNQPTHENECVSTKAIAFWTRCSDDFVTLLEAICNLLNLSLYLSAALKFV